MKVARPVRRAATGNGPEATRAPRPWPTLLGCRALECPRKSSAYSFLVRAGKIVPPVDTPRERAAARGIAFQPRHDHDGPLPEGVNLETLLDVLVGLAEYSPIGKQ